jgi:hypothetical protein
MGKSMRDKGLAAAAWLARASQDRETLEHWLDNAQQDLAWAETDGPQSRIAYMRGLRDGLIAALRDAQGDPR